MHRLLPPAALLATALAAPAVAATRDYAVGSFERVRVDGPFEVRIATGASPHASASGDRDLLDRLDIAVNGTTLVVRLGAGGWGETPARGGTTPPVVTLATPRLVSVALSAAARVSVAKMTAQRIDLSITGAGSLAVAGGAADQIVATLVGTGEMRLAGRANRVRLLTNGPGRIDAGDLVASDLTVRVEGLGETRANARYTAQVTSTGLGRITVTGGAKCTVTAAAGGPVSCGK